MKRLPAFFVRAFALMLLLTTPACATERTQTAGEPVELTVAAAADLQFAFAEIGTLYEQDTGNKVTFAFGSTGQLAQQIENGAPFDLFAAANVSFVEDLAEKDLVVPETVALYARGRIVLAVNREAGVSATTLEDLLSDKITHIAIANPEHAPYGIAAKEALIAAGVWEQVEGKVVYGENVRQTLQFVQTGDAQAGIVALSIANVPEITWTLIDDSLHNPLDQALAVVTGSPYRREAQEFADFINGEAGRPIMQKYGFVLPGETITTPAP
ncbi:MAG TPA: molybdate ABC transporter substrate-binding protein [Anaerolineales bacterium]|nr:molybdate ABC transporter substrate-binding protein [Anaerolineales bacterium]